MDDPSRDDQGPTVLAWSLPLYAIAVIVYSVRIGSRLYPKYALTAADYAISFSFVRTCPSPPPRLYRPGTAVSR